MDTPLPPRFTELYHAIEESTATLCSSIRHGMMNDTEAMYTFSTSLAALYKSLHEYYMLQRPREFVPPVASGDFEAMLKQALHKIYGLLTEYYQMLFSPVSCTHSVVGDSKYTRIYPSMMLFYVVTKIMLCLGQYCILYPEDEESNRESVRPADFSYARDNMLVMHDTAIFKMSVKELFDSVKALQNRWNLILYDTQLLLYLEMLEYRAAQLLHESWPSAVHNIDYYRKPVVPADRRTTSAAQERLEALYTYNDKLLWFFAGVFINMRIRIGHHAIAEHKPCPEAWYPSDWELGKIKAWFLKRAETTFADHITTEYRKAYLKLIMRPGEVEEFLMTRPNATSTEQQVYNQVRGKPATQRIQEFCGSRPDKEPIQDDEDKYPESPCTMGSVLLASFFKGEFADTSWHKYCLFRTDLQRRSMEFTYEEGPFLVQSFNRFNVFYRNEILVTNGFFKAIGCFLRIAEREFNGAIDGGKLLLFPLFESIYGPKRGLDVKLKWQTRNLKGCHRQQQGVSVVEQVVVTVHEEELETFTEQEEGGKRQRTAQERAPKRKRRRISQITL